MKIFDVRSLLSAAALVGAVVVGATAAQAQGRGDGPIIYVTSQGLYYDSIVTASVLPAVGPFQKLEEGGGGPFNLQTEYGPGDPEYVGGRWWVDKNSNNRMDGADEFFSCPLLAPGREEP